MRSTYWRCRICGYIAKGDAPPQVCPICGARREYFEPFIPRVMPDKEGSHRVRLSVETTDDVTVVTVHGRLDIDGVEQVEVEFMSAATDAKRLVVDMTGVDYASSAGIRLILSKAKAMQARGGQIAVCRLHPLVRQVFQIACLGRVFPIVDTRDEAVGELRRLVP
jgi:anti-anti-sigma factor